MFLCVRSKLSVFLLFDDPISRLSYGLMGAVLLANQYTSNVVVCILEGT